MKDFGWNLDFKLRYRFICVGLYWKRQGNCVDVYIYPLPCFSFHLSWWWSNGQ